MADGLILKASKEEYTKAMESLRTKVKDLETCRTDLEVQKTNIEKAFSGAVGSTYVQTISQQIENIKTTIEKVNIQITQIENYIANMGTAGNTALDLANQAGKAADAVFDEVSAEVDGVSEDIELAEEYYNKLPEWLRDKIPQWLDKATGRNTSEMIEELKKIFTGEGDWNSLGSALSTAIDTGSESTGVITPGTYVKSAFRALDDYMSDDSALSELLRGERFYEEQALQDMSNGDYASAAGNYLASMGTGGFAIAYETTEVLTETIADAVQTVLSPVEQWAGMIGTAYEGTNSWQSSAAEFTVSVTESFVQTIRDWL